MARYKKKKHSKLLFQPKAKHIVKKREVVEQEDIIMSSNPGSKTKKRSADLKVVKGKKKQIEKKKKVIIIAIAVALLVITILQLSLPAGIIGSAVNSLSLIGSGSYPLVLDGTRTLNAVSKGSYYYLLSNTHISAYSNAGKLLFSYAHGFENPVMETSSSRAMVFNQGSNQALVFNINGLKSTIETENNIITGAISDSGVFALATNSDKYNSAVTVYNKQEKVIYEWFSAEDTVNNLAISPSGKKIAVTVFNANSGQYRSVLNVFNFKSATPEHTETFENSLVYNLDNTYKSGFIVVTPSSVKYIKWWGYKSQNYESSYNTSIFRTYKDGYIAVFSRENDKTNNKIAVFSKSGKLKCDIEYNQIISDIALSGRHIYCMNDTEICRLNFEGEIISNASSGFGAIRTVITSTDTVAVITDNTVEKVKLKREK